MDFVYYFNYIEFGHLHWVILCIEFILYHCYFMAAKQSLIFKENFIKLFIIQRVHPQLIEFLYLHKTTIPPSPRGLCWAPQTSVILIFIPPLFCFRKLWSVRHPGLSGAGGRSGRLHSQGGLGAEQCGGRGVREGHPQPETGLQC